jgi:hypothetical protein
MGRLCKTHNQYTMKFSEAIEELKAGKMITCGLMHVRDQFVFMQIPSEIRSDIVPKMQSLPQSVKDKFQRRFEDPREFLNSIHYENQLAIVSSRNFISGWSPSAEDVLSDDWVVIE